MGDPVLSLQYFKYFKCVDKSRGKTIGAKELPRPLKTFQFNFPIVKTPGGKMSCLGTQVMKGRGRTKILNPRLSGHCHFSLRDELFLGGLVGINCKIMWTWCHCFWWWGRWWGHILATDSVLWLLLYSNLLSISFCVSFGNIYLVRKLPIVSGF